MASLSNTMPALEDEDEYQTQRDGGPSDQVFWSDSSGGGFQPISRTDPRYTGAGQQGSLPPSPDQTLYDGGGGNQAPDPSNPYQQPLPPAAPPPPMIQPQAPDPFGDAARDGGPMIQPPAPFDQQQRNQQLEAQADLGGSQQYLEREGGRQGWLERNGWSNLQQPPTGPPPMIQPKAPGDMESIQPWTEGVGGWPDVAPDGGPRGFIPQGQLGGFGQNQQTQDELQRLLTGRGPSAGQSLSQLMGGWS